jgi:integrase
MMNLTELPSVPSDRLVPVTDQLRLAVAAYLARFKGSSREHTSSDLRWFLAWCAERGLDPLAVRRAHLELYLRWMQEVRHFKPSTVSRRFSVVAGFYRTCVIDGLLEHSPTEHVRRATVPPPPAAGRHRPRDRRPHEWADPAQQPRRPDGPPRCHPPPAAPGRNRWRADHQAAPAHASPHLRHHHAGRGRGLA